MSRAGRDAGDRVLSRLADGEARLMAVSEDLTGGFAVYPSGDRRRRPTAKADAALIEALVSAGALAREGQGWRLSEAGRARLRRLAALGEDAFVAQHQHRGHRTILDESGVARTHRANLGASPLVRLRRTKTADGEAFLSERAFIAGERLRADAEAARMPARLTMDWEGGPREKHRSGASPTPAERCWAAKARMEAALDAIGPRLAGVVSRICLDEAGLDRVEREEGWPKRSGKVALRLGLESLADYYGLG